MPWKQIKKRNVFFEQWLLEGFIVVIVVVAVVKVLS